MTQRTLYRSRDEKVIAGVCGGLAQYLEVDPVLVRLIFVALAWLSGVGLALYVALALLLPQAPAGFGRGASGPSTWSTLNAGGRRERAKAFAALALILVGAYWLLESAGLLWWLRPDIFWPLLLVAVGILILATRRGRF